MTEHLAVGRPPREVVLDREGIPAPVMLALEARAAGNSWKDSAAMGNIAICSLREWRKFKVVRDTLNEMVRDKLAGATAKLVDATPRIADMLIAVALDPRSKPYSRVAAADLVFRTVATHLLEVNQQEQISAIREQLEVLEAGGPILDV